MKAPDGWYSFRTLLKVSIKVNYRQKKAENFLSDETLKIKRCRPMFCYLSLLFFFGGWFYSLTVTNHGETLTFFFTCYLKVLVDSLRHGFFSTSGGCVGPMRSPSGQNVRVPVLARPLHNVLEKDTLPSQCISSTKVLETVMTTWLDVKGLLTAL